MNFAYSIARNLNNFNMAQQEEVKEYFIILKAKKIDRDTLKQLEEDYECICDFYVERCWNWSHFYKVYKELRKQGLPPKKLPTLPDGEAEIVVHLKSRPHRGFEYALT